MKRIVSLSTLFISSILIFFCASTSHAQNVGSPVSVKLSLAEGKNVYRAGETIRLALTFSSDQSGFDLQMDRGTYLDKVLISPEEGLFDWKTDYYGGNEPISDASAFTNLTAEPAEIEVSLNDYYRFDRAGRFTVQIVTKRIRERKIASQDFDLESRPGLTSNSVSFEIKPMTVDEESAEARTLRSAIETKTDRLEKVRLAEELANLPGDAAIPEKIACFLSARSQPGSSYGGAMYKGLFLSRNRPLVIRKLEFVLNDVTKPADFEIVGILSSLKAREVQAKMGVPYKQSNSWYLPLSPDDPWLEANAYYLQIVSDSLSKRQGRNLVETAFGLFRENNLSSELKAYLKEILIKNFDSLDIFGREQLLSANWEQIRDPSLVPLIERMLNDTKYPDYGRINVQTTAIKRLIELDPQRAKPFVVSLIRDGNTALYDEAIDGLPENTLPEIDNAILGQLTGLAKAQDPTRLRAKSLFAARYASFSIYFPLLELYRQNKDTWQYDTKGILLGYFMKHNPQQGLEMLKEEAKITDENMRSSLFHNATRYTFPDTTSEFFESELMSDEPKAAATAAYILSEHGQLKHKAMIQRRLDDWVAIWRTKASQLEGPNVSQQDRREISLQVELISALVTSRAWSLSDTERRELRSKCLIQACKYYFRDETGQ
jgi:hypothetical protein